MLAIGYDDVAAVDVFDGTTLERVGGHKPINVRTSNGGISQVAWSLDGQTLLAAGALMDVQLRRLLLSWDGRGLGDDRRMTYCASDGAIGVDALSGRRVLVASTEPCRGLMDAGGERIWTVASPILNYLDQAVLLCVSENGQVVDFGFRGSKGAGSAI